MSEEEAANAPMILKAHILIGLTEEGEDKLGSNIPVGMVSFGDTDSVLRIYKFGLLVDPAFQQLDFGRKLTIQGLDWAFNTMNAHKVFGEILETDKRIVEGSLKAGFSHEGVSRSSIFLRGKFYDEDVISILRSEYIQQGVSNGR